MSFSRAIVHRANDVGDAGAVRYHTRVLVDHGVVGLASFIVALIVSLDERAAQTRLELFDGCIIEHAHNMLTNLLSQETLLNSMVAPVKGRVI